LHAYERLPAELTADDVGAANSHGAARWQALMAHPRIVQLAMGEMARTMLATVDARLGGECQTTLQLFSAHDSTLFGLLADFELEAPAAWPAYGATLAVELWRDASGKATLRFLFCGEALRCKVGAPPTECELVALERVREGCRALATAECTPDRPP
jgi:hypothetical protein